MEPKQESATLAPPERRLVTCTRGAMQIILHHDELLDQKSTKKTSTKVCSCLSSEKILAGIITVMCREAYCVHLCVFTTKVPIISKTAICNKTSRITNELKLLGLCDKNFCTSVLECIHVHMGEDCKTTHENFFMRHFQST